MNENATLKTTIKDLQDGNKKLSCSLDELDQYSRSQNLLIHGVPTPSDGSAEGNIIKSMVDLLNNNMPSLGLLESDISNAHRFGRVTTAAQSTTKPPSVVISFSRRVLRNSILEHRKELKGKRISVTEQLTPSRSAILKKATDLVATHHLNAAWSHDGRILIKPTINSRAIQIMTLSDLEHYG